MLVFVFLISGIEASAQVAPNNITSKPKPTLQQCRADLDAWSKIDPANDGESLLTYDDLLRMAVEMSDCGTLVDPDPRSPGGTAVKYGKVFDTIYKCISSRDSDFISRHGLLKQLMKEDKAGAR
jgi:hypothetical protein